MSRLWLEVRWGLKSLRHAPAPVWIAGLAFLVLFWQPTWTLGVDWWSNPDAGHGLLLVPIAIWLAWRRGRAGRLAAVVIAAVLVLTAYGDLDVRARARALGPELLEEPLEERWAAGHSRFAVYRDAAHWLEAQRPPGVRPVLLTDEVGVLGYYLPEYELRDSVGLATPGLSAAYLRNFRHVVQLYNPEYIVRGAWVTSLKGFTREINFGRGPGRSRSGPRYESVADFVGRRFSARVFARVHD